jgi:hypothetical protein
MTRAPRERPDHDLGEALRAGRKAVHLAENSASRRVRKRLDELGHQLSPHQQASDTADVLEQIRTLAGKRLR